VTKDVSLHRSYLDTLQCLRHIVHSYRKENEVTIFREGRVRPSTSLASCFIYETAE